MKHRMSQFKGIEVVDIYTRATGENLPRDFWIFFNDWCKAWKENDITKIEELQAHKDIEDYARLIEKVKKVIKREEEKIKKND